MSVNDETRAAAYRVRMAARIRTKRERERALHGDPAAAATVRAAWQPVESGQPVPLIGEPR